MRALATFLLAAIYATVAAQSNAAPDIPVYLQRPGETALVSSIDFPVPADGESELHLVPSALSWDQAAGLAFDIVWPPAGGTNAQVLVFVKDWEYFWYQAELPGLLTPGATNCLWVPLTARPDARQPRGHHGLLHARVLAAPDVLGIRLLNKGTGTGTVHIANARATPADRRGPPTIRNVQVNRRELPCFDKFEITFDLPDRYRDPFDADEIAATADITSPLGQIVTVDAFYTQR